MIDFTISRADLAVINHLDYVAAFHHWLLLELPNFCYTLSYDSHIYVTLLAEIGCFCPKLYGSRPIIGAFGLLVFEL